METVRLLDGNEMPVLGLGTWQLQGDAVAPALETALAIGYRHIDTAKMYGNEAEIGVILQRSAVPRSELWLTTKLMPLAADQVREAVQERCRLLRTDYLDLLLIHWPPADGCAPDMWAEFEKLQKDGTLRSIGVSNYDEGMLEDLANVSNTMPAINQIKLTPFEPQAATRDYCTECGIVVEAYSPLTRGDRLNDPVLEEIASKYHKTPAQILLRWCLDIGTVPLPKAGSEQHLRENFEIFDFSLDEYDMAQLDELAG